MPRIPRIYLEGALHYVTSRSIQGQDLFNDKEDFQMYLELLSKNKNQHGFKLFAFVIIPTHIHILVETKPETTLSEIMHNITSSYTKYYNKKYNREGHLFRGRFRAVLVEKDANLLRLTRYIHMNPVLLNLAAGPDKYLYSSYLYYIGQPTQLGGNISLKEEVAETLGYLKDKSYEDFAKEDTSEENKLLHKELNRKVFLGSEEFGKKIQEKIDQASKEESDEQGKRVYSLRIPVVSGLVLAALAASALLYSHKITRRASLVLSQEKAVALHQEQEIAFQIVGLDGSAWQIKFIAGTPFQTVDTLIFKDGKLSSENLNLNGYPASNYSTTKEAGRIIWETMQTSVSGTASWRGEVEGNAMRGILSLRQIDKDPQDFSFVSLKYKKI
ncbi:MAG: transposase [Candidatus Omnitrophota bacterium]